MAVGFTSGDPGKVDITGDILTGPVLLESTDAGGLDTFDSTSRLTVQSWQTNGNNFFGEGLRLDLMRAMAKNMIAWRLPRPPTTGGPETLRSVAWAGAHYYAQDQPDPNNPTVVHGHWSVEVPDSLDRLRTRLEIKFVDAAGVLGLDKTLVQTSAADLVVDCSNGQVLRLRTGAGASKFIEFGNDQWGAAPRWILGIPTASESGGNAGANFEIQRFSDAGALIGIPVIITRSSGRVTFGGTDGSQSGVDVNRNAAGTALNVNTNFAGAAGAVGYSHTALEATSRAVQVKITADPNSRLVIFADGRHEWGDGTLARDTTLYRSAADMLTTDDEFKSLRPAVNSGAFSASVTGDGVMRHVVFADGRHEWGPGIAGRDTNLYRAAADTLKTDGALHVGDTLRHLGAALGFYNSASVAKQTVSGSRAGNAALASLLTALATVGLVTDGSVA